MLRPSYLTSFRARVLAAFLTLAFIVIRVSPPTTKWRYQRYQSQSQSQSQEGCPTTSQNVVVIARTGASEAALRVPALMGTSLRCAEHVYLYSDLEQDVGPYHLADALDNVAQDVVDSNSEFEFYHRQLELWQNQGDLSELQGLKSTPQNKELAEWTSSHYNTDLAAWQLDKYKFFHVLEKTWAAKPDMDWYVMIDSDSYIIWPTLLRWLETLDPAKKSYFGCQIWMDEYWFAHGGAGIVLSRAAMETLIYNDTAARWDPKMEKYCCGDFVLAVALRDDYGVELQHAFPMFSQERWSTVPLGSEHFWCSPAISFHHLSPAEMKEIADFEENRLNMNKSAPWTHADIFRDFTMKSLPDESYRADWDGSFASDRFEFDKYHGLSLEPKSFQECLEACEADEECLQYTHHNETCFIGKVIRLGFRKEEDEGGMWQSGWHRARIDDWASMQPQCDEVEFLAPDAYSTG